MGLIMLGTASEKALDEMLSYARETQHEKIIRSLAVGVAFLMYGQREKADPVIQRMMEEKVSSAHGLPGRLADEVGCHFEIRWYVRHRPGVRWHRQQPGRAKTTPLCCLRRQ